MGVGGHFNVKSNGSLGVGEETSSLNRKSMGSHCEESGWMKYIFDHLGGLLLFILHYFKEMPKILCEAGLDLFRFVINCVCFENNFRRFKIYVLP